MVEMFLEMPSWLQVFLAVAMMIGLLVMWRFRSFVAVIAAGAIAIFLKLKVSKKDSK